MKQPGGELRWILSTKEHLCFDDDYLQHENELNQEVEQYA